MTKTNAQKTTAAKTTVRKASQLKTAFTTLKAELKTLTDTKKNALAKLAEQLASVGVLHYSGGTIPTDRLHPLDLKAIRKAKLIVAELAKVDRLYRFVATKDNYQRYRTELAGLISKCRAIAEERAEDGK